MELVAFVYHWPPSALDDLDLDQLESWAATAEQRLTLPT